MRTERWLVALLSLHLCCGMSPLRAQDLQHRDVTIRDTLPAAVKTDRRRIEERLPGTFSTDLKVLRGNVLSPVGENDPIKYALTRPGVSSGAEGFSAFFARGGNLGNNLFTLDGVRIYGLSHLLGLTTSVPGDAIETMDFCVGGFGGEQGGLTASHVSLHSATLDHKTLKTAASLSNTFLGATVSAPVVREKASVLASVRWSPFGLEYGLLKKSFDKEGRMPDLQMGVWDAYVKAAVSLSPRHEVTVSGFGSRDGYMIGFPDVEYTLGWENAMGHLSYRFMLPSTTVKADVSYNHFRNNMEHAMVLRGESSYVQLQTRIEEQRYGVSAEHSLFDGRFLVSEGLSHQRMVMSPGAAKVSESKIKVVEDSPYTEHVSRPVMTSGFVELSLRTSPLDMNATVRANHYDNRAPFSWDKWKGTLWEFSTSAKWRMIEGLGIEATYDNRVQFDHTLEGTPLGWSLDLVVPCTKRLVPERARQVYGGIFASYEGHALTLGGYYKKMKNLVYYTDAMAMFTSVAGGWNDHAQVGDGTSFGAELLYEGRLPETGAEWSVAYTWSKTDRRFPYIDNGKPFPARYDRRHILHASAQWKGINTGFTLQSGHWETVPAGQYVGRFPSAEIVLDYYTHPNNWQMPLYIRLDVGYQFDFQTGNVSGHPLSHSLTLGVFNVLNRHNPSMLTYDAETKTWNQVSLFPVMPSIKYVLSIER